MPIKQANHENIDDVAEFISHNYQTGYGSYVVIDSDFCKKVLRNGVILTNIKEGKIVATLFVIFINDKVCLPTHLCVDENKRDEGLAVELIEYGKKLGLKLNYNSNYRINFFERPNSLKINNWYRPLKIKACEENGYYFKESRISHLAYLVKEPVGIEIRKCSYDDFKAFIDWELNEKKFTQLSEIFKIHSVYKNNSLLGVFVYCPVNIYSTKYNRKIRIASTSMVRSNGEMKTVLKSLYHTANKDNCIFCYIYQIGENLTDEILEQTHALNVENPAYLEFDNLTFNLNDFSYLFI